MKTLNSLLLIPVACGFVACSHHDGAAPTAAQPSGATAQTDARAREHHRFVVRHFVGAESNPTQEVGIIDVDPNDMLVVEQAEGPTAPKLREAVAAMNNATSVPADGISDGLKVERGRPGFFDGEREHLRKYYGFELTPL